jgi:flagellar hook-length control protein FliK
MDAALPTAFPNAVGGAAPFAVPDADLFNAVLGQMMGQAEAAIEFGAESANTQDALPEDQDDASTEIDPTELVNPMFVEAAPVAQITPVATFVWTIPAATATTPAMLATHALDAAALETPTSFDALTTPDAEVLDAAVDVPTTIDMAAAIDLPLDAEAAPVARDDSKTPATRTQAIDVKTDAMPAATAPTDQPVAEVVEATGAQTRSFAPEIAEAINKGERVARAAKHEKIPVEPKIDAAGIRPLPFVAVERAYAGNEQSGSKPFDAPKDQAQLPGAPAAMASTSAATPVFAVPADGRSMLNVASVATGIDTVDIPAAMARDIDTHVPTQIVQSIRLQAINGGGEAIIRLNPDYLGEVVVAVKVEQGSVIAALQAETPAVRQWAERNESVLRQALAEQGLQLDKLTVTEKASETEREGDSHEGAREDAREEQARQQPRRRRPQSGEATFEVTV